MTQTIKAIETTYAGCRFRSRLEARWAVFFDYLGIEWLYEPQGYLVTDGEADPVPYLPDFYLPSLGVWVEVKGRMSPDDMQTLAYAAFDFRGGLPLDPSGTMTDDSTRNSMRILILGDIPRPNPADHIFHWSLRFHKGDVFPQRVWWSWDGYPRLVDEWNMWSGMAPIHSDGETDCKDNLARFAAVCTAEQRNLRVARGNPGNVGINAAYEQARSARFEHRAARR